MDIGQVVGKHRHAADGAAGDAADRVVHHLEILAPPAAFAGVGALAKPFAGQRSLQVAAGDLSVDGHALVIQQAAAEFDLRPVQRLHHLRMRPVEAGVAELAVH